MKYKHLQDKERTPAPNSTCPKGGVSCFKDSLVVNQTLVFQNKFCGKNPALRVAAKRCEQCREKPPKNILVYYINSIYLCV